MKIGDVVLTTNIAVRNKVTKPTMQASFKAHKGKAFAFLLLGTVSDGDQFSPEDVLRRLGWVPESEHATQRPLSSDGGESTAQSSSVACPAGDEHGTV